MAKHLHSNYIQSSNFIFVSAGLEMVGLFFAQDRLSNTTNIAIAVVTISLIVGFGFLVRQGLNWIKYFLLALIILGVIGMLFIPDNEAENPIAKGINIAQTIIEIWAMVLLFKIPKTSDRIAAR